MDDFNLGEMMAHCAESDLVLISYYETAIHTHFVTSVLYSYVMTTVHTVTPNDKILA